MDAYMVHRGGRQTSGNTNESGQQLRLKCTHWQQDARSRNIQWKRHESYSHTLWIWGDDQLNLHAYTSRVNYLGTRGTGRHHTEEDADWGRASGAGETNFAPSGCPEIELLVQDAVFLPRYEVLLGGGGGPLHFLTGHCLEANVDGYNLARRPSRSPPTCPPSMELPF